MTFDEAIFCMKQYLPDSDSLECMKCPYYHTIPIEGTENGFTCKADEAHKIAIKALETITKYKDAYNKGWDDGAKATYEHLKMCEEEQSGDLISKQAVIDIIHRFFTEEVDKIPTKKTEDGEVYVIHKCQPLFEMNKAICKRIKALSSVPTVQAIPIEEVLKIIEVEEKWLSQTRMSICDIEIAFNAIKSKIKQIEGSDKE